MKITGLTYHKGDVSMYLKPDTALLVNKKPFFLPHFSERIEARLCLVAKISKMGRCIGEKYASRYYSELAPALNLRVADCHFDSIDELTKAIAFDNSMVVGDFVSLDSSNFNIEHYKWFNNGNELTVGSLAESMDKAVAQVSSFITLRMGDMVAVDYVGAPVQLQREDIFIAQIDGQQQLYCKIK